MSSISLDEILRVWSQAPSAAAAAWVLGISRRTLYDHWQSASPEEVLQALAQSVASYETQLAQKQQARSLERAAAQAQLKAVRKESGRELTSLKRQLATLSNTLERVMRLLANSGVRVSGMEHPSDQPWQEIERLVRKNQAAD